MIMLIGSTQFKEKMRQYQKQLRAQGKEVEMPAFDEADLKPLEICKRNN